MQRGRYQVIVEVALSISGEYYACAKCSVRMYLSREPGKAREMPPGWRLYMGQVFCPGEHIEGRDA
jgi:hypothetical protein